MAKSYQCKHAISCVLKNRDVTGGELGSVFQEVIHFYTLRGKFSSVHPELRREGIVRVEVRKEGLHFISDSGGNIYFKTFTETGPRAGLRLAGPGGSLGG